MDPDKWEECDLNDNSGGVMISNLPLLFVDGKPTALPLMSVDDFLKFIPFMVRCSTGESASVPWSQLPRPPWWPARLPFRIPSNAATNKMLMVRIVERCYSFHGCPYLLQFCSSLMDVMPPCGYRFTDNRDGTSSMYHGKTGKLLVTFRNENRDYDKAPDPTKTSQKKLISSIHHNKEKKRNVMVQPPISDIYLCDKCDDEFVSLKEVQIHEKQCEGNSALTISMPSPEPDIIDDIISTDEQVPFLFQLGLQPTKQSGLAPYVSPRKQQQPAKVVSYNHFHFDSVDISSPFGRRILGRLRNYWKLNHAQLNVMRYERYVYAPLDGNYEASKTRNSNRWIVTFKRKRKNRCWTHLYCFTSEQKEERRRTINSGLNYRSRCSLFKCKQLYLKLKRLQRTEIDRYKPKQVPKLITLIDLSQLNGVKSVTNNVNLINLPVVDPQVLPSTSRFDSTNDVCQRIMNNKTITVTRIFRSTKEISPTKDSKTVNGVNCMPQKVIPSYENAQIEVIDLCDDDESQSNRKANALNGTASKNGRSHWSPKNSQELGRNSRVLTNGSHTPLSFPPRNNEKCLHSIITESVCVTTKVSISNKENFKSDLSLPKVAAVPEGYDASKDLTGCQNNHHVKLSKRIRSEVLRLKSDECRELNNNGLDLLHDFNGCSRKILTRRLAKKKLPTLTTRNSQFVIKPLLKSQLLIESLQKPDKLDKKFSHSKPHSPDENGNTNECSFPKVSKPFLEKKVVAIKRPLKHSYGRTVTKRPRLLRELLSLSQDECKEIRCKGFHPADVIRVVNGIHGQDSGKGKMEHSVLLNKPKSYYLSTKKLYSETNLRTIDENFHDSKFFFPDSSETRSLEKDNLYRQLYLLKDRQYVSKVQDLVNWKLTSNTKQQVHPLVRKETPRCTHRKLIRQQSGMCVLNYHLPQFR